MRVKLISIFVILFLLSTYISMEASSSDFILERGSCFKNPFVNDSKLSIPFDKDVKEMVNTAPLAFIENHGQLENDKVRFYTQGGGVWFTDDGVWFEIKEEIIDDNPESKIPLDTVGKFEPYVNKKYKRLILKQEFVGANQVQPLGKKQLEWNSNFFYGNDSSKWKINIPNYREIFYENIYEGIDLRYYNKNNCLKYDLIIHPEANPNQIRARYVGGENLEIDNSGSLLINTKLGKIVDGDLCIYQHYNDHLNIINGTFVIFNDFEYGFQIMSDYNPSETLIIDPNVFLRYSTYFGGSSNDYGYDIAVDSSGFAYVTGNTQSSDFPKTPGVYDPDYNGGTSDTFILKLNQTGSGLIYSSFIGGNSFDYGEGIEIDSVGNAIIIGRTLSSDFPTTSGVIQNAIAGSYDVFILKLNLSGSNLSYSTYIGGSGIDFGYGISINSIGEAFATGVTYSFDFPTTSGAYDNSINTMNDVFVFKLNHNGSKLNYSTFVGGNSGEQGNDICIDYKGNAFITGKTNSGNFPTSGNAFDDSFNGYHDGFVFKLNPTGSNIIYSSFFGGDEEDAGFSIALNSSGNAVVTGVTKSSNFLNTTGAFDSTFNGGKDAFVLKVNYNGSNVDFSTFIGGEDDEEGYGIVVDSMDNIILTGYTGSNNFPLTLDAFDSWQEMKECFLVKLYPNGSSIFYSTLLGISNDDFSRAIALDIENNVYLTGNTRSPSFPVTDGAFDTSYNGQMDGFISKFAFKPFINISAVTLLSDHKLTNQIFAKLAPYNFKVNIIDTVDASDIENVQLTLDPGGLGIQLEWDSKTGDFIKLSDPNNYVSIDPSSKISKEFNFWTIDFYLIFNWTYPDEEFHGVQVYAKSKTLLPAWFNISGLYRVENDIEFKGTLSVTGEDNRIINEKSLVRGGEILKWTGLTPVYENTDDVYPLNEEFDVIIYDETDSFWSDSPNSSEQFYIESETINLTYDTLFTYIVRLSEIPDENDKSNETFTIVLSRIPVESDKSNITFDVLIDADNVIFQNPIPSDTIWHTEAEILVGINITDIGGGIVNANTIKHSFSINNGTTWSNWSNILGLESAKSIRPQDVISLKNGKDNIIKWQAIDSVGNGPAESKSFIILVDTESVTFSNFWPLATEISPINNVQQGIIISDTLSGVDASTIQYSISNDSGKKWSIWQNVIGLQNSSKVTVQLNLTFKNGTENRIKWRASDIAGNEPVESPWYVINVNTWLSFEKPKVLLLSPPKNITLNQTEIRLSWELENKDMENVTYNLYFERSSPPKIFKTGISNTSIIIDGLNSDETYYWRVIPILENHQGYCTSGIWWFKIKIEEEKIFKINLYGIRTISLKPGENFSVELTIKNLGNLIDEIELTVQAGRLSGYLIIDNKSIILEVNESDTRILQITLPEDINPGAYEIIITATSRNSGNLVTDNYILTVDIQEIEKDSPTSELEMVYWELIIVLIIIFILIVISIFILKRRRQLKQEQLALKYITLKPGALPSRIINIDELPTSQSPISIPKTTFPSLPTSGLSKVSQEEPDKIIKSFPRLPPASTPTTPTEQPTPQVSTIEPITAPQVKRPEDTEIPQVLNVPGQPYVIPKKPDEDEK